MTCIVPGWIGLERALRELPPDRPAPPLIPPAEIVAVALELIRGGRSGTVIEMPPREWEAPAEP
jgi:hypothetical protein